MANSTVIIPKNFSQLGSEFKKAVEQGIQDATDDLLRVASLRSPVDEQNLEKNGTSDVKISSDKVVGMVSFQAMNKGYNYALKMDKGNYKLGEKSKIKSSKGVRSKFTKVAMKVGTGYLSGTVLECQTGYSNHINELIGKGIVKKSFNK